MRRRVVLPNRNILVRVLKNRAVHGISLSVPEVYQRQAALMRGKRQVAGKHGPENEEADVKKNEHPRV